MQSNSTNHNHKDSCIDKGIIYGMIFGVTFGLIFHNIGSGIGIGMSMGILAASLIDISKDRNLQLRPRVLLLGALLGAVVGALLGLAMGFLHGAQYAIYGPGPIGTLFGLPFKPEYLPLTVPLMAIIGVWIAFRRNGS